MEWREGRRWKQNRSTHYKKYYWTGLDGGLDGGLDVGLDGGLDGGLDDKLDDGLNCGFDGGLDGGLVGRLDGRLDGGLYCELDVAQVEITAYGALERCCPLPQFSWYMHFIIPADENSKWRTKLRYGQSPHRVQSEYLVVCCPYQQRMNTIEL